MVLVRSSQRILKNLPVDLFWKYSFFYCLTPKGPWVPYVEFSEFGQAAVNEFYF
jgi:hypothetical protein